MAQNHSLVGYWHNWNSSNAPYIPLTQVDSRYDWIEVAFALPAAGTDYSMTFTPDQGTQSAFIAQIQALQAQGKRVLISMGGGTATISLDNTTERDIFISTMGAILNTYNFDGIDIDFEGTSLTVSGGTITAPVDAKVINLIFAIKKIMHDYRLAHNNKKLLLTMAPETAFVQGGMSAYAGVWGAYLPVIHGLRDSLDLLQVQLYNSGSMYGINGVAYNQGTADFIVAMTEAVIAGFTAVGTGGPFTGIPADKVAVGLPACPSAAGSGFVNTTTVAAAINYLRGVGPKPGSYTLQQSGGYPALKGMMDWSINWDALSTCNSSPYEYAQNFESIFSTSVPLELLRFDASIAHKNIRLDWEISHSPELDFCEVEHAEDGLNYQTIGLRKAGYPPFFLHESPAPGMHYYRLKMYDKSGRHTYSLQRGIEIAPGQDVKIIPNPVYGFLQVSGRFKAEHYQIYNMKGQLMQEGLAEPDLPIDVQFLSNGHYILVLGSQKTSFVKALRRG